MINIKDNVNDELCNAAKKLRFKIFCLMFLGYIFFYFSRKSFTFMVPLMVNDLKITIYDIGLVNSIFYATYALSKFLGGIISDASQSKNIMFIGLIFTGLCNIFIGLSSNILIISIFWTINAFFQGWGWPPITKQLAHWYGKDERGFWWGLLSISHNIGGAIIPVVIGFLALNFFWRMNFYIIGLICVCIGIFFIIIIQSVSINQIKRNTIKLVDYSNYRILLNKHIFLLCVSYFLVYLVKTALNDWLILYMINQKEHTLLSASICIFYFEIGGIFGILLSGWFTDKIIKNRLLFLLVCINILFLFSVIFYNLPTGYKKIEQCVIFVLGFVIFTPQMLIGLISSELVNKKIVCTVNGLVGSCGYIGASLAGYPISLLINLSWDVYFIIILICEIVLLQVIIALIKESKK